MSNYPLLSSEEIEESRNKSELPHHWALRREFIINHNGDLPTERLVCLSHVFVNVECMNLTYPDEVMALVKELGLKVDKKLIEQMTYRVDESELPPREINQRSFYDMPARQQYNRGSNRGFGGRGYHERGFNERGYNERSGGFDDRRHGSQSHQNRQQPYSTSGSGAQSARQASNGGGRGFIDSPRPRSSRGFGNYSTSRQPGRPFSSQQSRSDQSGNWRDK